MKNIKDIFNDTRVIVDNPLDFLMDNGQYIQTGHFVSVCYFNEVKLSKNTRYINNDNDNILGEYIEKYKGSRFSEDFDKIRNSDEYQSGLTGKSKTGKFIFDIPVHIIDVARYNFQWRDLDKQKDFYDTNMALIKAAIRKHHGFTEFEPEYEFDENDWHNNPEYGGPGVFPRETPAEIERRKKKDHEWKEYLEKKEKGEDVESPSGWEPLFNEFQIHNKTKNIAFQQVLRRQNITEHKFYYAHESDGILEPLDTQVYKFLEKSFSRTNEKCEQLLSDEQKYIKDLNKAMELIQYREFIWDKILYMAVTAIKKNKDGKKEYSPFLWINTKVILQHMPWIDEESLNNIVYENAKISKEYLTDYFNQIETDNLNNWTEEEIMNKLSEAINTGVRNALLEYMKN
ncbi:MAG: hypothetical protein [Wendovervirus sonii]|uniref:Uncharacterized protein n=1 Tax=phage Lak_Megaphage_Sonny TaxID=3109229 RepID=A0ABZ0Z2Q4_9CAUD|nr:MAG: hypothetical protein [phage Lak_Megaphage_Sonny]